MPAKFHRLLKDGNPATGMVPSDMVAAECFLGKDHTETVDVPFRSSDGKVTAGVWEAAPFRQKIERYGVDELCTVIAGKVTVTDSAGKSETFGPGDTFVMDRDFAGEWHVTETLRKFWMIVEP